MAKLTELAELADVGQVATMVQCLRSAANGLEAGEFVRAELSMSHEEITPILATTVITLTVTY